MLRNNIFKYILLFVSLVLLQVLILNRVSFLGYAVPFAYIYFIIKLPIGYNRSLSTLLGFLLGIVIDVFCNTPGINAAATTFVGFICRPAQSLFFMMDDYKDQTPSMRLLGSPFSRFAVFMILAHHIALISLESFSYFNFKLMLIRILVSAILTFILIFAFEGFSLKKNSWQKSA